MKLLGPQTARPIRLAGFDIEAQHGATWGDFHSRIFLCASVAFDDEDGNVRYLAPNYIAQKLYRFTSFLRYPDLIVVAHNGRFDLDGINGELIRLGYPSLPPIKVSDTLKDSFRTGYMFPRTLAAMCELLEVDGHKIGFGQFDWEAVYRGEAWAMKKLRAYNENDALVVLKVREKMLQRGMLKYPYRMWTP